MKHLRKKPTSSLPTELRAADDPIREIYQLGRLYMEKCEFDRARKELEKGLLLSKKARDSVAISDLTAGLLRLEIESQNHKEIERLENELGSVIRDHDSEVPPSVWYTYGALADARGDAKRGRRIFLKSLKALKKQVPEKQQQSPEFLLMEARIWTMLARGLLNQNHLLRSEYVTIACLERFEALKLRTINGTLYTNLGVTKEKQGHLSEALECYKKAHVAFLEEHNWYYHLYVLYGYARISRLQQNYSQAYWYLDLIDRATKTGEFGLLRHEIALERKRLEDDAIDLMVDNHKGIIRTREGGIVQVGKQYILMDILKALSKAHDNNRTDIETGLSKAEIIEQVWKERYRPEAHDNKLYYNINRLRKLIEPDCKHPRYLLSWKEGYRLAPSLRVHFIQNQEG